MHSRNNLILQKLVYMCRSMKFHHQEVSCRILTLWYNVMSKSVQNYGELCSVLNPPWVLHLLSLSFSQCPCSSTVSLTAVSQPATELLNCIRNYRGRLSDRILTNLTDISWDYSVAPRKISKYFYSSLHNNFRSLGTPIQLLSFISLTFFYPLIVGVGGYRCT